MPMGLKYSEVKDAGMVFLGMKNPRSIYFTKKSVRPPEDGYIFHFWLILKFVFWRSLSLFMIFFL